MKKSQLIKFLVDLGFNKAIAEKIAADTKEDGNEIPENDLVKILDTHKKSQRELFENDKELIESIEASVKGKERSFVERKLKQQFGLTAEEIKGKTLEEIIAISGQKIAASSDKDSEKLQAEIFDLKKEIKRINEEVLPAKDAEVISEKRKIKLDNELTKKLASRKLTVPLDEVFPTIQQRLNHEFDLDIDDNGEINIYQKGTLNSEKKLKPKNSDGTGFIGIDDVIDDRLKRFKWLELSKAGQQGASGGDPVGGKKIDDDDHGNVLLKKAQEHMEAVKQQAANNKGDK